QKLDTFKVPLQVIEESATVIIREVDLRSVSEQKQLARIEEIFGEAGEMAFQLACAPLIHMSLLALAADRHVLVISLPAISADEATLANLLREIASCYAAVSEGAELADRPIQYNQASEWLNELLEEHDQAITQWDSLDPDLGTDVALPCELINSGPSSFKPEMLTLEMDQELINRIQMRAQTQPYTPSIFWLACWNVLLWRLAKQQSMVIGYASDGRNYGELEAALGPLSTYLPVESKVGQDYRFSELLSSLDEAVSKASAAQDYFVWKTAEPVEGKSQAAPFFHAVFGYRELPGRQFAGGLVFSLLKLVCHSDRFKIRLSCVRQEDALRLEFHYDATALAAETVTRFARHFETLVGDIVNRPEALISELKLLSAADYAQLL